MQVAVHMIMFGSELSIKMEFHSVLMGHGHWA